MAAAPFDTNESEPRAPDGSSPVSTQPDPDRIAEGWELRFVVEGLRAEALVRLYESLGYEAVADPLRSDLLPKDCTDCRVAIALGFRAIYTRRRA